MITPPPAQSPSVASQQSKTNASSATQCQGPLSPHLCLPPSLDPHYSPFTRQTDKATITLFHTGLISPFLLYNSSSWNALPLSHAITSQFKLLRILQNPSQMLHPPRYFPGHHQLSPSRENFISSSSLPRMTLCHASVDYLRVWLPQLGHKLSEGKTHF